MPARPDRSVVIDRAALEMARGQWQRWHRTSPGDHLRRLAGALSLPTCAETASWLAAIDPVGLDDEQRLARMRLADRVASWAQAQAATALADYVGPDRGDSDDDRHRRLEVRIARRCSDTAAAHDIVAARALAGPCLPVREQWTRGEIGYRHVSAVLDRTADLDDDVAAAVVERLVPSLPTIDATRVRAKATRILHRIDAQAQARQVRLRRRHSVGVTYRSLPDGLAEVTATLRAEDARAVIDHVDSTADAFLAHRQGCRPCIDALPDEIGPARAHAFMALVLGAADPSSSTQDDVDRPSAPVLAGRATRRRARSGELCVVIDLATLIGLADEPGTVAGQSVPAEIARELASECGSMRRLVTDPITGVLLDYGTRTYLPAALKRFVAARDGTCRAPGCGQPAARSQLDHVVPYPHGASSAANTHSLCKRDHDLKTRGDLIPERTLDGSTTWRTRHGQHRDVPPYLPTDYDDPPPF